MPEYQPQQKQKQTMIKPKPEYHAKAFEKNLYVIFKPQKHY